MFGYLPAPCRCQIGDQVDVYRSAFCGLYNALARDFDQPARFLVNRDAVFVALLTAAQSPSPPLVTFSTRCQPWRKPMPVLEGGAGPSFAGAVTLCGLEAKLDDERADERGLRAAGCRALAALSRSRFDRAHAALAAGGFPVAEVRRRLDVQQRCEARILDLGADPAEAAQPSAQAFGAILAHTARVAGAERNVEPLYVAGRYLGEMVYTLDAWQDLPDDQAHRRFNFLAAQTRTSRAGDREAASRLAREITAACQQQINQAWQAVELPRYRPLLEAVLLAGLPARSARLLEGGGGPGMITEDAGAAEERQQAYANDNCACFGPNGDCISCCYCCECCDCRECSSDGSGCCCDGGDGAGCCCDGGGDCSGCDCGGCDCNCSG